MIRAIFIFLVSVFFVSCSSVVCIGECPPSQRLGSTCADGTKSDGVGKSACSHHGGVACWRCKVEKEK